MTQNASEARHEPGPLQLQRARQAGNIPLSRPLAIAISTAMLLVLGSLVAGEVLEAWQQAARQSFAHAAVESYDADHIADDAWRILSPMMSALAPWLAGAMLLASVGWMLQTGFFFSPRLAMPQLQRLARARRQVGAAGLLRGALQALVISISLTVAVLVMAHQFDALANVAALPLDAALLSGVQWSLLVLAAVIGCLLAGGGVDYAVVRWSHHRRLRMTDEQLREEMRTHQVDPITEAQHQRFRREFQSRTRA